MRNLENSHNSDSVAFFCANHWRQYLLQVNPIHEFTNQHGVFLRGFQEFFQQLADLLKRFLGVALRVI